MPNPKKIALVEKLAEDIKSAKSAALFQYQGLNAADIAQLRDRVKAAGGRIEVIKNRLISRSLEKLSLTLPEPLVGPTAVALSFDDEIAPLKEIDRINKEKDLTSFKFGIFGLQLLDASALARFLSLPSRSALLAQFIGTLANPLQRLAYALRFNQSQLVLTLKAIADKK